MNKFIKYLKNFIFKLDPSIYNYSKLIEYFQKDNSNKYLDMLNTTNNICESINSKLNFYLPKKATNNSSFIKSISKVLLNEEFKGIYKVRKDYKIHSLIKLIEDLNFNDNIAWIDYALFFKYLKSIINIYNKDSSEKDIIYMINKILDLKEADDEEEINDENINENNEDYYLDSDSDNDNINMIEEIYENNNENFNLSNIKNINKNESLIKDGELDFMNLNYINEFDNSESNKLINLLGKCKLDDDDVSKKNDNKSCDNKSSLNWFKNPLKERLSNRMEKNDNIYNKYLVEEKKPKKKKIFIPKIFLIKMLGKKKKKDGYQKYNI